MGEKNKVGGMHMSTQTITSESESESESEYFRKLFTYCIQRNLPVQLCTSIAEYSCTAHCFVGS